MSLVSKHGMHSDLGRPSYLSCSSSFVDELFEMFMSLDVGEAGPVRLYMLDADARHFSFVRLL